MHLHNYFVQILESISFEYDSRVGGFGYPGPKKYEYTEIFSSVIGFEYPKILIWFLETKNSGFLAY